MDHDTPATLRPELPQPLELPPGIAPVEGPAYQWGQCVVALGDLVNDGSFPDVPDGAVLVDVGSEGEVVQVGVHEASQLPVYMVDFAGRVVGCAEGEIMLAMELHDLARQARPSLGAQP
jgi:nitrogen fixation protein NifZ